MKDYYQILGLSEDSNEEEIKKAFRKLAFQHHPDKNPGREKEAEARFKDINEAYGVLSDPDKRRQYDLARKGVGAWSQRPGFAYSQQDIFNGFFNNQAAFNEMDRMFAEAGLRFDEDFLRRVFFSGQGVVFRFGARTGGVRFQSFSYGQPYAGARPARRPGLIDRIAARLTAGLFRLLIRALAGPSQPQHLDYETGLEVSRQEAENGAEKEITYHRNGRSKKLIVKIPAGVKTGTTIRLKGMGQQSSRASGDLYLRVNIQD